MESKNSKLDDDVRTYCDVLRSCSLPEVASWKDEDLQRIFRWSSYFRQVHCRCARRASLMEKFDKRFREIGHHGGWRFGGEPLSCAFLGQSQHYLTKALLENPGLSVELREKVLHKYEESEGKEAVEILVKHVEELDSSRQLLKTLHNISIKVNKHVETCHLNCIPQPGLVSVDAQFLLEEVHWLLSLGQATNEPGAVSSSKALVHKKLHGLTLEAKGGMEVVLQSLIMAPGGTNDPQALVPISFEVLDKERRVILECFLQQLRCKDATTTTVAATHSRLNAFQQRLLHECSPKLLANVSTVHSTFFREYIQILMTKAEELDPFSVQHKILSSNTQDPKAGRDRKGRGSDTVTDLDTEMDHTDAVEGSSDFDLLISHFRTLTQSGDHAKECVSLLKSKIQPPISEKYHLPPMVGTIWNRILHAVYIH